MDDESEKSSDLRAIVELFAKHGVEFLVIGGRAEQLMGGARVTYDTDLCYLRSAGNLERLAAALRQIKPGLRGAPADLPFQIDARALALNDCA